MAHSLIQSWTSVAANENNGNLQTATVTVSGANAGNILFGGITLRENDAGDTLTTINTPTGWTLINSVVTAVYGSALFYRTASGDSSDNFAPTWDSNSYLRLLVAEYSGIAVPDEDSSANQVDTTSVSGGTATPTSAEGVGFSMLGARRNIDWATDNQSAGISIDNSYTIDLCGANANNGMPLVGFATKAFTSTAAQNPQWSTSDSGGYCSAINAVFPYPATELVIDSVETGNTIYDGTTATAQLSGSVTASGKKVYVKQGASTVEQTVTSEDGSSVTFTVDVSSLDRGDATLEVTNPA